MRRRGAHKPDGRPLAELVRILMADLHGPDRADVVIDRLDGARDATVLAALDPNWDAPRLGLEPATVARLRRLGERGSTGAFGTELLSAMPFKAARSWLVAHAEVGAATAELVLDAVGRRDDAVVT